MVLTWTATVYKCLLILLTPLWQMLLWHQVAHATILSGIISLCTDLRFRQKPSYRHKVWAKNQVENEIISKEREYKEDLKQWQCNQQTGEKLYGGKGCQCFDKLFVSTILIQSGDFSKRFLFQTFPSLNSFHFKRSFNLWHASPSM